ncbi:MAG: hypothetical protein N3A38_08105, partial [Planctomycetota bacterium]|nr:hypothetical protein [Planctomycetota bacterium]
PGYMSPEQASEARSARKPADVFSLGATLYALFAGRAPFAGSSLVAVLDATRHRPHEPIRKLRPDVSEVTERLLDICLSKEPASRYPDASALLEALKICRASVGRPAAEAETLLRVSALAKAAEVGAPVETPAPPGAPPGPPPEEGCARPPRRAAAPDSHVGRDASGMEPGRHPAAPGLSAGREADAAGHPRGEGRPWRRWLILAAGLGLIALPAAAAAAMYLIGFTLGLSELAVMSVPALAGLAAIMAWAILSGRRVAAAAFACILLAAAGSAGWYFLAGPGAAAIFGPPRSRMADEAAEAEADAKAWAAAERALEEAGGDLVQRRAALEAYLAARPVGARAADARAMLAAARKIEEACAALTAAIPVALEAKRNGEWRQVLDALEGPLAAMGEYRHPARPAAEALARQAREELKKRKDFADRLREAQELLAAESFEEAKAAFVAASAVWPDAPPAEAKKVADGIRAAQSGAMEKRYRAAMDAGRAALAAERWADAEGRFAKALEEKPGDEAAARGLAGAKAGAEKERLAEAGRRAKQLEDETSDPPNINRIMLVSGTLNGIRIDPSSPVIRVSAGTRITGSILVRVLNRMPPAAIAPVAATPTWGNPQTNYWRVSPHVSIGETMQTVKVDLAAPENTGTYYIAVAMAGTYNIEQILSGTHPAWEADWKRGNKVALQPHEVFERAIRRGWVYFDWHSPEGAKRGTLALTAVRIEVEARN